MTRDPFLEPQDDEVGRFLEQARTTFVKPPSADVERGHLAAMVGAFEAPEPSSAPRRNPLMQRILAIGAVKALAIGVVALVATGSALAAAGSLPEPAQDAVANTVDNVGLHIPGGDDETEVAETEENEQEDAEPDDADATVDHFGSTAGPPARSTTGCPDGFEGNHGQFVSGTEETPRDEAARSDCGKPEQAVDGDEGESEDGEQGRSAEHRKDGEHRPEDQEQGRGGPQQGGSSEGS